MGVQEGEETHLYKVNKPSPDGFPWLGGREESTCLLESI